MYDEHLLCLYVGKLTRLSEKSAKSILWREYSAFEEKKPKQSAALVGIMDFVYYR
jgi:hypothetical protein